MSRYRVLDMLSKERAHLMDLSRHIVIRNTFESLVIGVVIGMALGPDKPLELWFKALLIGWALLCLWFAWTATRTLLNQLAQPYAQERRDGK